MKLLRITHYALRITFYGLGCPRQIGLHSFILIGELVLMVTLYLWLGQVRMLRLTHSIEDQRSSRQCRC